ncbi:MAG: transposase [Bdellovibrionaceae bacterium]|nr:transposase [Pseudobdellovibrionaceae bacterium]
MGLPARGKLHFIQPGKPAQNARIESLNAQLRNRLLNIHGFANLQEARTGRTVTQVLHCRPASWFINRQTPEQ